MDKHPILDNVAEFLTFNSNQKPSRAARPAAMRCSNFSNYTFQVLIFHMSLPGTCQLSLSGKHIEGGSGPIIL